MQTRLHAIFQDIFYHNIVRNAASTALIRKPRVPQKQLIDFDLIVAPQILACFAYQIINTKQETDAVSLVLFFSHKIPFQVILAGTLTGVQGDIRCKVLAALSTVK